jgi:hypothetical protein
MTPHQQQLHRVVVDKGSLAATLGSQLMTFLFFILIFALLISGDLNDLLIFYFNF